MRHWMRLLKEAGIRCHEADARSLEPLDKWAIRPVPLEESQVVILTYERMLKEAACLTTSVLADYNLLLCDDSEGWLTARQTLYGQHEAN